MLDNLLGVVDDTSLAGNDGESEESDPERLPAALMLINPQTGAICNANSAASRFYGYPVALLKTMYITEIDTMAPEILMPLLQRVLAMKLPYYKMSHRVSSGEIRNVEIISGPIAVDGEVLLYTVVHDCTENQKMYERLCRSESRYRTILNTVFEGLFQTSPAGRILSANFAFARMLGYDSPEEMVKAVTNIGQQIYVNAEDRAEIMRRAAKEEVVMGFETRFVKKDRNIIWVLINIKAVNDAHGNVERFHGGIVDITERKVVEDALRESEYRLRLIAENVNDAFLIYDRNSATLIYTNKICRMIADVPLEHAVTTIDQLLVNVHPDDRTAVADAYRSGKTSSVEYRVVYHDGRVRWVSLRSFPVKDAGQQWMYTVGVGTDITEMKNAQAAAELQRKELIQADKMASLGIIVSGVAHEINNPNNFIMLNTPLVRKAWECMLPVLNRYRGDFKQSYVGKMTLYDFADYLMPLIDGILEGSKRISRIVADLKDYARPDAGNMDGTIDFRQTVNSAISLMHNTFKKSSVNLYVSIGDKPVMVQGNFQRLEQVVINLFQNAIDALRTVDKRSVMVYLDMADEAMVHLSVRDNGCGIESSVLPHITEPFFTTKRANGGTGLGLSVSNKIIADHGGSLLFTSEVGIGTSADLLIPRRCG